MIRRDFLKTSALLGAGAAITSCGFGNGTPGVPHKKSGDGRIHLRFFPYELELRHTFTIGIDTPDVVREKTLECASKFNILKVKVGLENDRGMIETIREVTDLPLAVDANQGWKDRSEALDMIFWLAGKGVVMAEQPMSKGYARLYDGDFLRCHGGRCNLF